MLLCGELLVMKIVADLAAQRGVGTSYGHGQLIPLL